MAKITTKIGKKLVEQEISDEAVNRLIKEIKTRGTHQNLERIIEKHLKKKKIIK